MKLNRHDDIIITVFTHLIDFAEVDQLHDFGLDLIIQVGMLLSYYQYRIFSL